MLMTRQEVCDLLKVSMTQLYLMIEDGFPKPFHIAKRAVRWKRDEVLAWLDAREGER